MNELDAVVLTVDRPDLGLTKGHVGTIVDKMADEDFLVEFISVVSGRTYVLVHLQARELLKLIEDGEPVGEFAAA